MPVLARCIVALLVFLAVFFFSFFFVSAKIAPAETIWLPHWAALLAASISAFWVWRTMRVASGGILTTILHWAAIAGAVGFCGGFFGPMILNPQGSQGPLLGILVTGPLGFIGGGIAGLMYALFRRLAAH
jgi:hypothetical protein